MEGDTVRLRSAATHWSLEGDSQLLSVLQSLHQKIITKCQDTNTQLDGMVSALDNASIDLQNVNNKFMALSNSQFVESRVYEDELELADCNIKEESSKPEARSSLSSLKLGLQVLESLHEVVVVATIDSDSDEDHSPWRVLRPRARGRLPHVVGSQAWRDAAHAGLSSDADSDDSEDKRASALEEYSDSDSDHRTVSPSSLSSMTSHVPPPPVTSQHHAQTEVQIPEPELDESPQPRKLYTVEKPIPAQIFPDEPPPLDRFEDDSDDDIFAELHKQSYPHSNKSHNAAEDLFGSGPYVKRNTEVDDIGSIVTNAVARENSPLFPKPVETESMATPRETYAEPVVKKPVGGISLFGSKGSESIGAAILKRNQRQSSSESEETESQIKKANIIEDLFTKPMKKVKNEASNAKHKPVVEIPKDKVLFSDNIFDDIDDIFTSNVVIKTKDSKNKTSIFDDDLFAADKSDNNDLFNDEIKDRSDIRKSKPLYERSEEPKEKVKRIFDSDSEDDLFSDVKFKNNNEETDTNYKKIISDDETPHTHSEQSSEIIESNTEIKVDQLKYQLSTNIFDDDNEGDLFGGGGKSQSQDISNLRTEVDANMGERLQTSDANHDKRLEITRTNKVKITEPETKVLRLEKEGIEEKYISVTKSIDNNGPDSDASNVELLNETKLDQEGIKPFSNIIQNNENEVPDVSDQKIPSLPETGFLEKAELPKEDIKKEVTEQNYSKDMFVDIFDDLPPEFEKPVESKKSKNVNALFDDDSDDEALFFKKDDVITDEKPDLEFKSDRFQIFHDEPPDIDVDFSQKSRNTHQVPAKFDLPVQENLVNETERFGNITKEEDLITKTEKPDKETLTEDFPSKNKLNLDNVNSNSITNNEIKSKTDILKLLENEKNEEMLKAHKHMDADIFSDSIKNDSNEKTSKSDIKAYDKDDTDSSESERKPVGRLRPVSININVSSLLPGATPKKSKGNEEIDGQTASRNNEEYSPDVTEPQMAKSVSFKGNLDSDVLDNKLSKERAKIQVKRRPSTRRARLEAVRKSGLDFGSDSTDNSSSFDEPVKEKHKNDQVSVPYKILKDETKLNSDGNKTNSEIKEVTSKVVYILNDEDIFEVPAGTAAVPTSMADDLFKSISTKDNAKENITHTDKQQSLVDTVSEKQKIKVDKTKKSLFDDMSDDDTELFKKPVHKVFDSDSESELFSGKKDNGTRESVSKVEQKKPKETLLKDQKVKENKVAKKVTKALFSDDSDEDLFGGSRKKIDFKETPKPKPSAAKTSQSFEDPLSVSRDDDT